MVKRKFSIALYATATWVISRLNILMGRREEPEQSYTEYLTISCISTEGFSGLLADGKCSTKTNWGSTTMISRVFAC